jgi:hypothetical protein
MPTEPSAPSGDDLAERVTGIESLLGPADNMHLHGVIPFFVGVELGGTPDVLTFSSYTPKGKLYVTCELVGTEEQPTNQDGHQYELAVCQAEPETWALNLILKLSYYTLETPLDHGSTMDISSVVPASSTIRPLVFRTLGQYTAFGKPASILCCVGITARELEFCLRHGSERLFKRMPPQYIVTETLRRDFI